jgi:hypothetical protein
MKILANFRQAAILPQLPDPSLKIRHPDPLSKIRHRTLCSPPTVCPGIRHTFTVRCSVQSTDFGFALNG